MLSTLRPRLTYANVVSTLCLFIVLGGSSYAAVTLNKNSVRSTHIKNGQVTRVDLARNSVDTTKVANSGLLAEDFAPGQLPAGAEGPRGPEGPAGPQGAQGAQGPSGSPDTPADILNKLKQVDGTGSGLDADALHGDNRDRLPRERVRFARAPHNDNVQDLLVDHGTKLNLRVTDDGAVDTDRSVIVRKVNFGSDLILVPPTGAQQTVGSNSPATLTTTENHLEFFVRTFNSSHHVRCSFWQDGTAEMVACVDVNASEDFGG